MPLTPREIVAHLDRHIIGQARAKRAVAVAVRDRWRRLRLDAELAREVAPKNIIMVGPTGVGKTEIARRLASLVGAPFIKVEASKYTEVGYHGRDVESMIRDLLELAVAMARAEQADAVRGKAETRVHDQIVTLLLGGATDAEPDLRSRLGEKLRDGMFEDREIEISVREKQTIPIIGGAGPDQLDPGFASMLEGILPERTHRRRVTVARARAILLDQETDRLVDNEKIVEQAIDRTEQTGIVFLDELDKVAAPADGRAGADVSRQGVQRDLLPIVEGSAVNTRHGVVHTDRILFIAAGAFHSAAVSDLMPELQGRFPIRVELDALTREDFRRILTEPDAALTKQTAALLATEGLEITFDPGAIDAIADLAAETNAGMENIGARRLVTVLEHVFEQIGFDAPDTAKKGETRIRITAEFVRERLAGVMSDQDLRKFVL